MIEMRKVIILGANGVMGAGCGQVFAAAGIPTVFLARTREKAEAGRARAIRRGKSEALGERIGVGSYDEDLARELADADLVLEAVAEDRDVKIEMLARIDADRRGDTVVATVSSGLSIAELCAERSETFRRRFLGIHFFNPPHVIKGCELVPHQDGAGTDPDLVAALASFLTERLGRELIVTADTPAFCGNRIGFKVLNECAQLAEKYGAVFIDQLLGPHSGRAMGPLATVDFVGWDVHRAIVDNLHAHTLDEAHGAFAIPAYMRALIARGHLGDKTAERGGFYRVHRDPGNGNGNGHGAGNGNGKANGGRRFAFDPRLGDYVEITCPPPAIAEQMAALHRAGHHREAFDLFASADGEAELLRRIVLGYISYALGRVGDVVASIEDVDRIMGHGFRWAPPGLLVDLIGPRRTIELLDDHDLPVPPALLEAADDELPLSEVTSTEVGRWFPVPA